MKIQDLHSVAEKLNRVSDELNKEIKLIEDEFNRLSLGVTTSVPFKISGELVENYQVGYGRNGNKWGLFVRAFILDKFQQDWELLKAPRQIRIEALSHLPSLINHLNTVVIDLTVRIEEKAKQAKEFAEVIKKVNNENHRPLTPSKRDTTSRR